LNEKEIEAFKRRPLGVELPECTANMSFRDNKSALHGERQNRDISFSETWQCGPFEFALQKIDRLGYAMKELRTEYGQWVDFDESLH
jgi:hypothetical protein